MSNVDQLIRDVIERNGAPPVDAEPEVRRKLAEEIARATNEILPDALSRSNAAAARELAETGIYSFGHNLLTAAQAKQVVRYLEGCPVYNAHVPAQSDGRPRYLQRSFGLFENAKKFPFGSYPLHDVLAAPFLLEAALSDEAVSLATSYLGCTPTLYSLNAWWAFGGKKVDVTRVWHRDPDDYKFLALFFFLTDVGDYGGEHVYVKYSHDPKMMTRHLQAQGMKPEFPFSDHTQVPQSHPFYDNNSLYCRGEAGSAFMADTYGVHRGAPSSKDRLVCWARYGLHAGRSYVADGTEPVSRSVLGDRIEWTERNCYITRLIVK